VVQAHLDYLRPRKPRVSMNPYLLVAAMILLIGEALVRRLTA
jgi:hypothetical protein